MKADPGAFFEAAYEQFLAARSREEVAIHHYNLAGLTMRIEFAGPRLFDRLGRAFLHLTQAKEAATSLAIHARDSSRGPMVPPPWSEAGYGPRGEIRGFNTERYRTAFDHGTGALSMLDLEQGRALFWTRDTAELPVYETGAPFRAIIGWWLEQNQRVLVHGGAVAFGHDGILLAGTGGSGKSTTALLCLQAGWKYLADDYCALNLAAAPEVCSLYGSAKIAREWLRDVPQLREMAAGKTEMHGEKQLLFLPESHPGRLQSSAACKLILLPRVASQPTSSLEPATAAEALRALAPSSIFQTAAAGAVSFQRLAGFVNRVPVRRLNLAQDFAEIPGLVKRSLEEI